MKAVKIMLAVTASIAFAAIAFCAVEVALCARQARNGIAEIQKSVASLVTRVDATVTDLDRTVQIAGDAIDEARDIESDNRGEIAQVNRQSVDTLKHVDDLVQSLDATQKQAGASIANTTVQFVPLMQQAQRDLAELQPAIAQIAPLLQRSTDIAVNLSNATADVEHEIHKIVYPPPRKWYQKYFLDPLRTAAHLVTIPIK